MSAYPNVEPQDRLGACLATCNTLGRILDSVFDGIITIDRRMRVISFNHAAATITDSRSTGRGQALFRIFADGLFDAGAPLRNALEKNEYLSGLEREIVGKAGQRRVVLVTINPLFHATGDPGGVVVALRDLQQIHDLRQQLKGQSAFHAIIEKNHKMREIYGLIEQVADSSASVLIHGESGTGKELVARAIHQQGPRRQRPFVTVNCAALVESLLESELLGHVKDAFTGAVNSKLGRFEIADGGTIFLDEIGDISPLIQVKLLRVLQEKEFERVGRARRTKLTCA